MTKYTKKLFNRHKAAARDCKTDVRYPGEAAGRDLPYSGKESRRKPSGKGQLRASIP